MRIRAGWVKSFIVALAGAWVGWGCAPETSGPDAAVTNPAESQSLRIVSLAPNLTELAYAAGAGDFLVATVEYSDYPEPALALPRIGDAFRIDFEQLAQLDPDLILVWESGNPRAMQQRLRDLGYELLVLEPATIEDIAEHTRLIGRVAGTSDQANAAADRFLAELATTWERYGAEPDTRVFFQISASPWYTFNGEHMVSRIIERCGGRNVFADLPALAATVSLEAVVATDPEVIISPTAESADVAWQQAWQRFTSVTAVREAHFVNVDRDAASRSSLRLAEAAEQICSSLHRIRQNGKTR